MTDDWVSTSYVLSPAAQALETKVYFSSWTLKDVGGKGTLNYCTFSA